MNAVTKAEGDKLALIRRTVAKDCNDDEFRLFVHICQAVRLDPLRRQAHAFVYNKSDEAKRQLTVVTSIGGYRSIADRTGNYRPDDAAPRYTMCDPDEKTNPEGIESCEVTVYKFSHGQWWPVVGQAFWNEYVPLTISAAPDDVIWEDTGEIWPDSGKPKKKKVIKPGAAVTQVIDPGKTGWTKMPRIMLAKCAEAAALRKAWPDDFANIHAEEETHRQEAFDAVAAIEQAAQADRLLKIGGPNLFIVDWCDGKPLDMVPGGKFTDRVLAYLKTCEGPATVSVFAERNAVTLRQFWAYKPGEGLVIKKEIEKAQSLTVSNEQEAEIEAAR